MVNNKNHHLIKRGSIWYFRKKINGKLTKKAFSGSLTEARELRDQYLKEILVYGDVQTNEPLNGDGPLFGELSQKWAKITSKRVKYSTFRGYRIAMNAYLLKTFGNTPIGKISYLDIEEFIS